MTVILNSLRIAFIIPSLEFKGPIVFTKYLVESLTGRVSYIEIFYFRNSSEIDMHVKTTRISFYNKYDFLSFDIVHTTMAKPDIYASIFIDRKKWISSAHNFMDMDLKMLYNPFVATVKIFAWRTALKRCRNIIVSSKPMLNYYNKFWGHRFFSIVPYGIKNSCCSKVDDTDKSLLDNNRSKFDIVIGSVGVMIARKGFGQLLYLLKKHVTSCLLIIGDGPEKNELLKKAKSEQLDDRVFCLGFRKNSSRYYEYFDIYAHVSYSEGFGLAMLEPFEKGLPVICSDLDIYKSFFEDDDVALFKPGNLESLNDAYIKLINRIEDFQVTSRKVFCRHFSLSNMADKHLSFYYNVKENN